MIGVFYLDSTESWFKPAWKREGASEFESMRFIALGTVLQQMLQIETGVSRCFHCLHITDVDYPGCCRWPKSGVLFLIRFLHSAGNY
jgi:hypothetical protein